MKLTEPFEWTDQAKEVAWALAQGYSPEEIEKEVEKVSLSARTIYRYKTHPDFQAEVDRLSLMVGVASRAERLRIAAKVVRQKMKDNKVQTEKDLLDWLKFSQGETDGVKLDLAALIEALQSDPSDK